MVWTREAEDGGQNSSNIDPQQGGSDKARWEAAAMESQGGARGEKWGVNGTQVAAGGSAGGRNQEMCQQQLHQPPDRRHPTPDKRNVSPLVGGAEDIPASAEGVLGGHFYDFFFSVDKILIKNPPREKIAVQQETEEGNAAKKARFNTDVRVERNVASSSNMGESLAPPGTVGGGYGKNVVMNPVEENIEEEKKQNESEEMLSEEESEEVGNELLIDTMVEEAQKNQNNEEGGNVDSGMVSYDEIIVNSMQIVPSFVSGKKFSSYLDACMGEPVVTEMDPSETSGHQKMQSYLVQSPDNSSEKVEVIPTPPMREEMQVRFSKRNVGANVEHLGVTAERMAQKRDLQGNRISPGNSFEVLSNLEIVSAAAKMGVNIPDGTFETIDTIRELEISKANIAKKVDKNDKQQDKILFITNAAGEASHLDTKWVGDEGLGVDDFTVVRSRKKERKKI
ncbi:hypothetical protein D1007_52048 [Hordeum vulgare]|nr:hypothetical protein D1007_52048 [Hordeum vulgare]